MPSQPAAPRGVAVTIPRSPRPSGSPSRKRTARSHLPTQDTGHRPPTQCPVRQSTVMDRFRAASQPRLEQSAATVRLRPLHGKENSRISLKPALHSATEGPE